jgi:hypothetical protein
MIRHVVLLRPSAAATPAEIEVAITRVAALKGVIDGIVDVRTGANTSPEGLGRGYTHKEGPYKKQFEAGVTFLATQSMKQN